MAGEIASTFVRIRPNTAGFQQEAERGIKSSLIGVGKVVGGIFAAQGAVTGIRDVANAAAQHQAAFAVLTKTIEDANAATVIFGKGIKEILTKEGELKGFNDEELASSFTRLVSVTHNSKEAFKELALAEDVARARHIDVATAALAISRAEQGSTISLSRLGIVIPKVSTHMARLHHEHDLAVASGVKFTGQVGLQYKASLLAATAADKQATKIAALDVVQKRFGGTAATFATTALGKFATFQQEIHNFEVAIGDALLPTLTAGAAGLGGFVHGLTVSGAAGRTAREIMAELGQVLHVLGDAFQLIAPPALAVSHALLAVAGSIGVPGLVLAVASYKGLGLALSGAGGAATRFKALLAAGAAAQAASAEGANTTRAAELAYAASVKASTAVVEQSIAPTEASTAALNLNAAARERIAVIPAPRAAAAVAPLTAVGVNAAAQAEQVRRQTAGAAEGQTQFALAGEQATRTVALQTDAFVANTAAVRADLVAVEADAVAQDELARAVGAAGLEFATAVTTIRDSFEAINAAHDAALKGSGALSANTAALNGQGAASAKAAEGGQALNGTLTENAALSQSAAVGAREVAAGQLQLFDASVLATGGLQALNGELAANTALNVADAAANDARAVSALGSAASTALSGISKLGSGLLALAGGWTTVVIAAAAGLAFGIYKVVTAESAMEAATKRLIDADGKLGASFKATAAQADRLSQLRTELPILRASLAQDRLNVRTARQALETTNLTKGTAAYSQLVINLQSAQASLTSAVREFNSTLADEHDALATLHADKKTTLNQIDEEIKKTKELAAASQASNAQPRVGFRGTVASGLSAADVIVDAAAAKKAFEKGEREAARADFKAHFDRLARAHLLIANLTKIFDQIPSPKTFSIVIHAEHANAALRELAQNFEATNPTVRSFFQRFSAESKGLTADFPRLAAKLLLLADYAKALGRIPTRRETQIVLNAPNARAALTGLLKILHQMELTGGPAGKKTAEAFLKAFLASLPTSGPLANLFEAAATSAKKAALGITGETSKELAASLKSVDAQVVQTQTTIAAAASKLADAQRSLADTIRTGNQQIHDSIASADANLASIGDSISNMLGQFLDAQKKSGQGADISEAEFRRLRAKLEAGKGGVGTQTAGETAAFLAEKNQTTAATSDLQDRKDKAARNIRDLVDEFNRGQITLRQLNRGIAKVLESDGFSYKKAGKLLGSAFVNGFKDEVAGISQQGAAILAVPAGLRRGIDGQQPNIIKPLETIHQVNDSIRAAEKERKKDAAALAKDERLYAKERQRQHAITNELLRRRTVAAERPANTARALRAELAPLAAKTTAITKPQLNDILRLAEEAGLAIPQGLVKGIRSGGPHAAAETRKLAEILLAELRRVHRSKSPSEATEEIGRDFGLGLALGITAESPAVTRRVKTLADRAVATARASFAPGIKTTLAVHQQIKLLRELSVVEGDIRRAATAPKIPSILAARQQITVRRQLHVEGGGDTVRALTALPKLTVRHETVASVRAAAAPVSAPVSAVRADSDREMLGELRAQRRTTAHGDELLLSEARRQTHALNEIVTAERRKPVHPKPSHAPGENARAARSAAHHNLVA